MVRQGRPLGALPENWGSIPSTYVEVGIHLPENPVSGKQMPSSGFLGHYMHTLHKHAGKTRINMKKRRKNK